MHTEGMRLAPRAVFVGCLLALATAVPVAIAAMGSPNAMKDLSPKADYEGIRHLHYEFGPIKVQPGQNLIDLGAIPADQKPKVPGYITAFRPNLVYGDKSVPAVDIVHMHHGVWLVDGEPRWAMGEEKTNFDLPKGFGWRYTPQQNWAMNHMIHDLVPNKAEVTITWDMDFVPDSSPAAKDIKEVRTQWMDVAGLRAYPVFDALRKWGHKGRYTFPDDAPASERSIVGQAQRWVVRRDETLVGTAGHLHPGGLWTDLRVTRDGRTVRLFRSKAKYWEPAGAVSWDVAMTRTPNDWRVQLKKGDVVTVSGTYDTRRASWYESMAIMPIAVYDGAGAGGTDPFVTPPNQKGFLTHGHLPENDNHGGEPGALPDARKLLSGSLSSAGATIPVQDFVYGRSDLGRLGKRVPTIRRGQALTFVNKDDRATQAGIYHTITACKAPCNRITGIAYPLADGKVDFDSGELGTGPSFFTAASNRVKWETPKTLKAGTYTYFCRIHPFMRGAFRVKK
jgi:plastocyanin